MYSYLEMLRNKLRRRAFSASKLTPNKLLQLSFRALRLPAHLPSASGMLAARPLLPTTSSVNARWTLPSAC